MAGSDQGSNSNAVGSAASTASKSAARRVISASVTKVGAQALGSIAPGVGNVVAFVATEALPRLAKSLKNNLHKMILGGLILLTMALNAASVALATTIGSMFIVVAVVAFILFIITSGGYIVGPATSSFGGGGLPPVATECQSIPRPKPELDRSQILFSSDGQYAYPIQPFNQNGLPLCYHWDYDLPPSGVRGGRDSEGRLLRDADGNLIINRATDIFPLGSAGAMERDEIIGRPLVAYTSGVINTISTTDRLGGKYVILSGDDGRHYYYAHACSIYVEEGQRVSVGEVIAISDRTGLNASRTPEHLHFAINSEEPRFFWGDADVCPSEDFDEKFGLTTCAQTPVPCVDPSEGVGPPPDPDSN